jgi:hypothetical protein
MSSGKTFLFTIVVAIFLITGNANALTIAGITFPDNGFADVVLSTNAAASHFVTGDPQVVVTATFAITGSNQDSYFDPSGGEYVQLGFTDNVIRNGVGNDFAVFEIGTAEVAAIRLTSGGTQRTAQSIYTGFDNSWGAPINVAWFDLADFGLGPNATIDSLFLYPVGAPEFSAVGAIPEPSTALLLGVGMMGLGMKRRRRRTRRGCC